ncbi:MAG: porin [Bacteroidota bacterium]|nr:porin [Bacteroidota bacterium]
MNNCNIKIVFIFYALCSLPLISVSQNLLLGDYIPGNGITLASDDDNYKVVLRGYAQSLFESRRVRYDSVGFFDKSVYNRFRARRVRLRISGKQSNPGFSYRLQLNLAESEVENDELSNVLWDAWVGYNINKYYRVSFGQKSSPTDNIEVLMASNTLQLPERSRLTGAFSNIREIGLFLDGRNNIKGSKWVIKPSINITTGDGYGYKFNSKDFGGLKYGARVNFLPFGLFRNFGQFRQGDLVRELNPKLLIGFSASYNDGITSRRGRRNGDFIYYTLNGTDTSYQLPDFFKFGADILFKYRGFSLIGEFVQTKAFIPDGITHRNDRYNNPNNLTTNFRTYSPADYVRTQMMLGSGLNLQAGYIFKSLFSIDGRFTSLRPDELSFLNNSLFYNRNKYYEIGVSKYFTKNYTFKVQASYRIIDDARLRHPNFDRDEFDASENVFYLMVQLAF